MSTLERNEAIIRGETPKPPEPNFMVLSLILVAKRLGAGLLVVGVVGALLGAFYGIYCLLDAHPTLWWYFVGAFAILLIYKLGTWITQP